MREENQAGKRALFSVAGYDPSSGAGVLLDVAVFRRLGFLGAGILTAVTAQNSRQVREVRCLGPRFLLDQYRTLVTEIAPAGIKLGMVGCRGNIPALSHILAGHPDIPIVVDPVLKSSSGRWLLEKAALSAYLALIEGRISVLTPNLDESALISGLRPRSPEAMKETARRIAERIAAPCLVKGGHLAQRVVDVLYDGREFHLFPHAKIAGDVHGTGCFLSSSLLGYLVLGHPLVEACALASKLTRSALRRAARFGKGRQIFFSF